MDAGGALSVCGGSPAGGDGASPDGTGGDAGPASVNAPL